MQKRTYVRFLRTKLGKDAEKIFLRVRGPHTYFESLGRTSFKSDPLRQRELAIATQRRVTSLCHKPVECSTRSDGTLKRLLTLEK